MREARDTPAKRREQRLVEPLSAFRRMDAKARTRLTRALKPFASGEHVWLGNGGAAEGCRRARAAGMDVADATFSRIVRLAGKDAFSYGELVALSGDFYGSPSELYEERPAALPWLWEPNDLSGLRASLGKELRWIEDRQRGRGPLAYPDENLRMAWNAKSYVELALRNVDHFGWHNVVAYCRHHAAALALAVRARGADGDPWRRALVYNAFADHFLSDGFAAGHVRVPRAEIRAWAQSRGLSDKLAGALSKLLHDADGHVTTIHGTAEGARADEDGLAVENAAGEAWSTFCDGQLFLFPGSVASAAVRVPVSAIAASVLELVTAWKKATVPGRTFSATRLVAFPPPAAPGLSEKFSSRLPPRRVKALYDAAAWYTKIPWIGPGLTRAHVRELFAELPGLMQRFREGVRSDLAVYPELELRLAPEYVRAYLAIH